MKDEELKSVLEVLKAAYVPADLDEQREKAIAACEQALAAPVQGPVGEVNRYGLDSHGRKWHGIHWYDPNVDVAHGTKLYTAAQPAVPDAFGTREGEHPQYVQGWNDCRAEMLKGMKP